MAEIKPMALIESMSKKVCEHSDVYFRTNKKTGKVYTGKLCNPSTKVLRKCRRLCVRFWQDRASKRPSWWLSTTLRIRLEVCSVLR